jgi:fatty-acyl-CoA synthase
MKPSLKATQTYLSVALAVAVLPVASILIGAVATKTGLLDWKLGFGLLTFRGPPLLAMLGLATGLVGLVLALIVDAKGLWFKGVLPLVITLAVMGGFAGLMAKAKSVPMIHDVATDWTTPLTFSPAVMTARGAESNPVESDPRGPGKDGAPGERVADLNAKTCPEAKPIVLTSDASDAFNKVKAALTGAGLTIVAEAPAQGRIEAVATSTLYGFKDDVVARIVPSEGTTRIDLRSVSRVGLSDLGANCKRITTIRAALVK